MSGIFCCYLRTLPTSGLCFCIYQHQKCIIYVSCTHFLLGELHDPWSFCLILSRSGNSCVFLVQVWPIILIYLQFTSLHIPSRNMFLNASKKETVEIDYIQWQEIITCQQPIITYQLFIPYLICLPALQYLSTAYHFVHTFHCIYFTLVIYKYCSCMSVYGCTQRHDFDESSTWV